MSDSSTDPRDPSAPSDLRLTAQPLYKRAEDAMTRRIAEGIWAPGHRLPNETALAAEFGVSHGTLRKALAALERQGLVERSPGRGTRIARTTDETALYAFFRLRGPDGERVIPEPIAEELFEDDASEDEREILALTEPKVWRITRLRGHDGRPVALERMTLPAERFAGLDSHVPLPNSLYPFYESAFGQSVVAARDDLEAVPAEPFEAAQLKLEPGTPLLLATRIARTLTGPPAEIRTSRFVTGALAYRVDLSK